MATYYRIKVEDRYVSYISIGECYDVDNYVETNTTDLMTDWSKPIFETTKYPKYAIKSADEDKINSLYDMLTSLFGYNYGFKVEEYEELQLTNEI